MEEIWKDVPSYEGYYQVSNLGNFRSLPRVIRYKSNGTRNYPAKKLLTESTKDNYQRITLMKEGVKARYQIVTNLEWCTPSENMIHADNTRLRDMSKHHPSNAKKIKCLETGEIFVSYYQAIKWLGKTTNSLSALVRGTRNYGRAFGYHWQFIE